MKQNKITFSNLAMATIILVIGVVGMFNAPAYSKAQAALMVQQSPVQGGEINIGTGVHYFGYGSEVTLIANPKPGFRFLYWLGEVSDEVSNNTIAFVNGPKIIIAVYEREEYASLEEITFTPKGQMMPSRVVGASDYSSGSSTSGSEKEKEKKYYPPVYPEDDPFPVPTPEPATLILLGLGSMLVFKKNRKAGV